MFLGPQAPEDSKETWESRDPLEAEEVKVTQGVWDHLGLKDPKDHLVLKDRKAREALSAQKAFLESKGPRVALDKLVPKGSQAQRGM